MATKKVDNNAGSSQAEGVSVKHINGQHSVQTTGTQETTTQPTEQAEPKKTIEIENFVDIIVDEVTKRVLEGVKEMLEDEKKTIGISVPGERQDAPVQKEYKPKEKRVKLKK